MDIVFVEMDLDLLGFLIVLIVPVLELFLKMDIVSLVQQINNGKEGSVYVSLGSQHNLMDHVFKVVLVLVATPINALLVHTDRQVDHVCHVPLLVSVVFLLRDAHHAEILVLSLIMEFVWLHNKSLFVVTV